jgi:hypothetical protein
MGAVIYNTLKRRLSLTVAPRMCDTNCGLIGADVRPNWKGSRRGRASPASNGDSSWLGGVWKSYEVVGPSILERLKLLTSGKPIASL